MPASGAYLAAYEGLKRKFSQLQGTDPNKLSPTTTLLAGGLAGIANWLAFGEIIRPKYP